MPILCSRASVSLRLRSKSESSGVASVFCWLSDCTGYIKKCHLTLCELKYRFTAHPSCVKEQIETCMCMHILIQNYNTNLLHTHVCMHTRTHTNSAFNVSRPDKKQSNTQTKHTRVWYSVSASSVNLLTFFLTSFFFLSSSFLFFSSLIWARRCFLRSSSAFRSLLSDMVSYGASSKRIEQEWAVYSTVATCSGYILIWHSIKGYQFFL